MIGGRADDVSGSDVLVSVSITTYNHAPYIEQAVESVLAQETDFPFEIVIGDDCSTDGTRELLHELARRHPGRLTLVLPEHNLGHRGVPMFARTLDVVRGRYIAMLDGDDYWTATDKLAVQVAHLEANPLCSMCFHDVLELWDDGSRPPARMVGSALVGPVHVDMILLSCVVPSCSPMFRREAICPLPPGFRELPVADMPLYVLATEHGHVEYIDRVMGVWRMHGKGAWSGLDGVGQDLLVLDAYERLDHMTEGRYGGTIGRLTRAGRYRLALKYGKCGDTRAARHFAWLALKDGPAPDLPFVPLAKAMTASHLRRFRDFLKGSHGRSPRRL